MPEKPRQYWVIRIKYPPEGSAPVYVNASRTWYTSDINCAYRAYTESEAMQHANLDGEEVIFIDEDIR